MGFMQSVWRMLGADDHDYSGEDEIVDYETHQRTRAVVREPEEFQEIIRMPGQEAAASSTVVVVRPSADANGSFTFSLKNYAAHLLAHNALILDVTELAETDIEEATRVVDYLSGVAEAVDGSVFEITNNIFIFAPQRVQLSGDPLRQVEVY